MLFFSTPSCGGAVTTYGCYNRIYPYATAGKELINLIYANGLTPGNTYYLMIDGANGDQCDFRIAANSGVNILSIIPPNPAVCNGQSISLSATGGNGTTYNWSSTSPNITFSPATGATVSATPSGTTTTIPVTVSSTTPAGCPNSTTVNLIVNPNPATPTINTTPATCSAPGSSTISNYNASFTYAFSPTGPSVGTGGSIIGMNIGTNYTVTAGSGNCTSAPSSSFSNGAQLSSLTTPTISSNPATCSVAGSSTISNYNAGLTYTFNPTGPSVGTGGAISGMTVGTSYTVTASNGSCTSVASGSFSNAAQQNTPAIPTIATAASRSRPRPGCVPCGIRARHSRTRWRRG